MKIYKRTGIDTVYYEKYTILQVLKLEDKVR